MSSSDTIVLVTEDDQIQVIETAGDEIIVFRDGDIDVLVDASEVTILESTDQEMIVIVSEGNRGQAGPAGAPGSPGATGPTGPPGTGNTEYTYNFAVAQTEWVIHHNLNSKGIRVALFELDGDTEKEGDVSFPDNDTIVVTWYYAETGIARLYY
jgi:hypothetical protein